MKTITKTLIAISVMMISFSAFAIKGSEGSASALATTYKVTVHMPESSPTVLQNVYVVITDQNGRLVAPAQPLIIGKTEYKFAEPGPVIGIRIAKLSNGLRPHDDSWVCNEDVKTGIFENGFTYMFNLYLHIFLLAPGEAGTE